MQIQKFLLAAANKDLTRWLIRYWQVSAPPGAAPTISFWATGSESAGLRRWSIRTSLWETGYTELFKLSVTERPGICEVEIEPTQPLAETWLCGMLDSLAPGRASGAVQPMPAFPPPPAKAVGATPAALLPGEQILPSAPQSPAPVPVDANVPYVPGRDGRRREWKAIWRMIRPCIAQGMSCAEIARWLFKCHRSHYRTKQTLAKIIKAGEAGLLD